MVGAVMKVAERDMKRIGRMVRGACVAGLAVAARPSAAASARREGAREGLLVVICGSLDMYVITYRASSAARADCKRKSALAADVGR